MRKFLLGFLFFHVGIGVSAEKLSPPFDLIALRLESVPPVIELESSAGDKILKTGRYMALTSKEIVRGSCWDYIDAVYNRSGYPRNKRQTILKGKKNSGPYANPNSIQAGDWLYFINHSYNDVPHSGIFVRWVDKEKRVASILSYGGESRKKPGRYRDYDLSHVYNIMRPKD